MSKKDELIELSDNLLSELRGMIAGARKQVAQVTNTALVMLYWQIGKRIHHEILDEKRAEYGRQIVASLGRQLAFEFGAGFGKLSACQTSREEEVEQGLVGDFHQDRV